MWFLLQAAAAGAAKMTGAAAGAAPAAGAAATTGAAHAAGTAPAAAAAGTAATNAAVNAANSAATAAAGAPDAAAAATHHGMNLWTILLNASPVSKLVFATLIPSTALDQYRGDVTGSLCAFASNVRCA